MKIIHTHNRIQDGNFPINKLNSIEGIKCSKIESIDKNTLLKMVTEEYLIEVDMTDPKETNEEVAFALGMLVQSYLSNNH